MSKYAVTLTKGHVLRHAPAQSAQGAEAALICFHFPESGKWSCRLLGSGKRLLSPDPLTCVPI